MNFDTSSPTVNRPFEVGRTNTIRSQHRQPTRRQSFAIWAAAALPMALLMWVLAPIVAHGLHGPQALARGLIASLEDRGALIGIAVHSAPVVVLSSAALVAVLK